MRKRKKDQSNLEHSEIIEAIPKACSDELAAVEFFEQRLWKGTPHCFHCGSVSVYKMIDAKTGLRNKRFRWRCRDCHQQFTIRQGTVFEESRIPLRHWAFAFWRAATSKKGVAALEIKRQTGLSYKSALFLMNRIRFAMAPDAATNPKLIGTIECDEVWIGGKPRKGTGPHKTGRGTSKTPVFVAVERGGKIRRKIVASVNGETLKAAIRETVNVRQSMLLTDENPAYKAIGPEFIGGHMTVNHRDGEYSRNDVNNNTAESSNALIKRGLVGIYHNVSKEYLHRYLWQWDFCWNHRAMNDGERVEKLIQAADGKRMMYKQPLSDKGVK
jgi:transposase-like protein